MITILVAYDKDRVIGCDGKIPWHIPADLRAFRERTLGHSIVMGRKTWQSLPKQPLDGRFNFVISTKVWHAPYTQDGPFFFGSLERVLDQARGEVFIIGGQQVYETALNKDFVNKVIATEINTYYGGDRHFPRLGDDWDKTVVESYDHYNVCEYVKKNKTGDKPVTND